AQRWIVYEPITDHLRQVRRARTSMGLCQQVDEAEHAGDVRRTRPSRGRTAVLMTLFPTLGDVGRRWGYVLIELPQQYSDAVQQRAATQERRCLIGERAVCRTGEESHQRRMQCRL